MKPCFTNYLTAGLLAISMAAPCVAADISQSLRNNTDIHSEPENYFELGLLVAAGKSPQLTEEDDDFAGAGVVINGSYNWRGFFIDAYVESANFLTLGYNAYNSENWSYDVILTPTGEGISEDTDDRFIGLDTRENSTMVGGRATGYFEGNIVQLTLLHDISGTSNGTVLTAALGRNWQFRNWNLHGMLGLTYNDARHVDYYLGVSEEEASRTDFTAYDSGAVLAFNAEAGVTYPITEDWVFRATTRFGTGIGSSSDSSLYLNDRSNAVTLSTSISYVF